MRELLQKWVDSCVFQLSWDKVEKVYPTLDIETIQHYHQIQAHFSELLTEKQATFNGFPIRILDLLKTPISKWIKCVFTSPPYIPGDNWGSSLTPDTERNLQWVTNFLYNLWMTHSWNPSPGLWQDRYSFWEGGICPTNIKSLKNGTIIITDLATSIKIFVALNIRVIK